MGAMRPLIIVVMATATAHAQPPEGDYSNMDRGEVIAIAEGVPSCLDVVADDKAGVKAAHEHMRDMFTTLHVRVKSKVLEIAGIDTSEPGIALTDVTRTDTYVSGWLDLQQDNDRGRLWQMAGVRDPINTLHEEIQIGWAIKNADGDLVCGDVVIGIAMRGDLPKAKKPSMKKAKAK